jgi:hypothetical protein
MYIKNCSDMISVQDPGMRTFILQLAELKYQSFISNCLETYCLGPMNGCFGDEIRSLLSQQSSQEKICSPSQLSCVNKWVNCYQTDLVLLYEALLTVSCSTNSKDTGYLVETSQCYPPGSGIDVSPPNSTIACTNEDKTTACVKGVSMAGVDLSVQAVTDLVYLKYATDCDPRQSCTSAAAVCFGQVAASFNTKDGSIILTEAQLCKAQSLLQGCHQQTLCATTYTAQILTFLETTCAADGLSK